MKKTILLVLTFLFGFTTIAEELKFKVIKETDIYEYDSAISAYSLFPLEKGEQLTYLKSIHSDDTSDKYLAKIKTYDNVTGWVVLDDVELLGSEKLPKSITERTWVLSYYQNILKFPKRETFYKYEPYWRDEFIAEPNPMEPYEWWDVFKLGNRISKFKLHDYFIECDMMHEAGSGGMFVVKKVVNDTKGIINIDVITLYNNNDAKFGFIQKVAKRGEEHTFILKQDGDYLTIYLNDLDIVLVELIAVDDKFIQAVYDVALENTIDQSSIKWPKRASE